MSPTPFEAGGAFEPEGKPSGRCPGDAELEQSLSQAKQVFDVRLPDTGYWRGQIKCQAACPVNTDARGYVRAIAEGKYEQAYLIARGPNPLASICGRVCGAPCEQACRRGDYDQPVAIRALKRFVCGQFGPESRADGGQGLVEFMKQAAQRHPLRECQGKEELLSLLQSLTEGAIPPASGQSVGIIGSGPAGLAAAHDLALLGISVTLYEMEPELGGMLMVGIPEYRLPRRVVRSEIEVIQALGVQAVTGCQVGRDVSLPELRARHQAVIVAVGAKRSRLLPIAGADASGVLGGVEFLRAVSLGAVPALGRRVVVIGGGNVAYDVGRTVLRQISIDAARTAKRSSGVSEVYLCSLESLEEMPADDVEIIEGDEEGILRRNGIGPKEILVDDDNRVTGVKFRRCLRTLDEKGQFSPVFDDNDVSEIPCDNVLVAIGQAFDLSFIDAARDGLKMTQSGLIECQPESGQTSAPDVFVAGDLAYGPKLLIHAVASGKAVARAVYERLTGRRLVAEQMELHFPLPLYQREPGYETQPRLTLPARPAAARLARQDIPIELELGEEQARREASRCLDCGVNTIFDGRRCLLCGGCVDVCPERCLQIVSLAGLSQATFAAALLESDEPDQSVESNRSDRSEKSNSFDAQGFSAVLKDETRCIRCALCAERCPTGAITMERFYFKEVFQCPGV